MIFLEDTEEITIKNFFCNEKCYVLFYCVFKKHKTYKFPSSYMPYMFKNKGLRSVFDVLCLV